MLNVDCGIYEREIGTRRSQTEMLQLDKRLSNGHGHCALYIVYNYVAYYEYYIFLLNLCVLIN